MITRLHIPEDIAPLPVNAAVSLVAHGYEETRGATVRRFTELDLFTHLLSAYGTRGTMYPRIGN